MKAHDEGSTITATVFLNSVAKFSISSWVNFALNLLFVMVATRLFSPEIYGQINIFNSASHIGMSLACFGLDAAFIRFYNEPPRGWDARRLLLQCMALSVGGLLAIALTVLPLFADAISYQLFHHASKILSIILVANMMSLLILRFLGNCYRLANDAWQYTVQNILVQICSRTIVLFSAFVDTSIEAILLFNTAGVVLLSCFYLVYQNKFFPEKLMFSLNGFREIGRFAFYAWPAQVLGQGNAFFIPYIIAQQLDNSAVGIYASAGFFAAAFGVVQSGFGTYWASFMYAHYKTEQEKIAQVHRFVVVAVIFLMGCFIMFQHVAYSLIGPKFQSSREFFTLLLIYPMAMAIGETTSYGISIAKKNQLSLIAIMVMICFQVIGSWILLPHFGLFGAALSSVGASIVYLCLATYWGQYYYRTIQNYRQTFCGVFFLLLLSVSNVYLMDNYWLEVAFVISLYGLTGALYRVEILQAAQFLRLHITGILG